jgi:2-dehydropantoate 2-reductase
MRIGIMGAGALGGYFGGRLVAAGYDVSMIARGAHLLAMQENGLQITSPMGDLHVPVVNAVSDPAEVGVVDVVMLLVKNYDVAEASRAIAPMIGPETMVTTFQNGVSAPGIVGDIVGAEKVVAGVARIPASIPEPGKINHTAPYDTMVFGEVDGAVTPRVQRFSDALAAAGTTPVISENILHDLWIKFIMQATLSAMTTLTRLDIGPLRENEASRELFIAASLEAENVGRAIVPDLPEDLAAENWEFLMGFTRNMHASMLDDLLRGKRLEVNSMSGEVVRLGKLHGVETPIHSVFNAALQPFVEGAPD